MTSEPGTATIPTDSTTGISVDKTATPADGTTVVLGEEITYSFTVQNTGTVTLRGVTVTDPMFNGGQPIACTPSDLAADESATCTAQVHTVTQEDVDRGYVLNNATATGTPPDGFTPPEGGDTTTTTVEQTPAISVVKDVARNADSTVAFTDANANTILDMGDQITYTFLVTNEGTVTLHDVAITDPMLAAADPAVTITCDPALLAPDAQVTCTSSAYTVTEADQTAGNIHNAATATGITPDTTTPDGTPVPGTPVDSPEDAADVPVTTPVTGLGLVKRAALNDGNANALADVNETIVYSFDVTNTGNVPLDRITVSDPMLEGVGITPACPEGPLAPGATATCTAEPYTVTQANVDSGTIQNAATAHGVDPNAPGTDVPSNEGTTDTPTNRQSAMSLDKRATTIEDANGNGITDAGDTVVYTFVVANTGTVTVSGIEVTDPMLEGIAITADPNFDGTLEPGTSVVFTSEPYTIQSDAVVGGTVPNTATATGSGPGGLTIPPATDDEVFPVTAPAPQLQLDKSSEITQDGGTTGLADAGDVITYTFTVTNTGNVPVSNIAVTDTMNNGAVLAISPADFTGPLGVGNSTTFTATYTVTQADVDSELASLDNVAHATGETPETPGVTVPPSNTDSETVPLPIDAPSLHVAKSADAAVDVDGDGLVDAGDTVVYHFVVINNGNVTVSGVKLEDSLLDDAGVTVTCDPATPATLAPGEATTCVSEPYTITEADQAAGNVHNMALATGTGPGSEEPGTPVEPPLTDPEPTVPGIELDKVGTLEDANGNGFADEGEQITYSFSVTNTGTAPLAPVTISDPALGLDGAACVSSLAAAATVTCETTATYTVTAADVTRGYAYNLASATGTQVDETGQPILDGDGNPITPTDGDDWGVSTTPPPSGTPGEPVTSNEDTTDTPVTVPAPALSLVKTASDASGDGAVVKDETITYTFTVTNTGNVTVEDVAISDSLLEANGVAVNCEATVLAPGASTVCTAEYVATQTDVDAGQVVNVATATGRDPINDIPVESGEDDAVTPAPSVPAIDLVKSVALAADADGDGVADAGDTLTFAFEVTNTGPVTLRDVTVSDPTLAAAGIEVSCPATELAPGASMTCTAGEYTVTDAEARAGAVQNTATVVGVSTTGLPVNATSTVTTPTDLDVPPSTPEPTPPADPTQPPAAPEPKLPSTGVDVNGTLGLTAGLLLLGGMLVELADRRRPFRRR